MYGLARVLAACVTIFSPLYCLGRVKLECEREHQEHLLLSVMPAYIAAEVKIMKEQ